MPTHTGIGFSKEYDEETAAKNAAYDSKLSCSDGRIDFALCFCTYQYDPQKVALVVAKTLNTENVIGSSTAALIFPDEIVNHGISVITFQSSESSFTINQIPDIENKDMIEVGEQLAGGLIQNAAAQPPQALLYFFDGYTYNSEKIADGIHSVTNGSIVTVGAGSCDYFRMNKSFQLYKSNATSKSVTALLISGDCSVVTSGRHGWKPLGKPRVVDNASGNTIASINDTKAIGIYEEYLGQETNELLSSQLSRTSILYPLGINLEGSDEYLIRNAVDILDDGSIVSQGDVPENSYVHIMIGSKDSAREAVKEAAMDLYNKVRQRDIKLLLVLESMTRLKLMGRSALDEIQIIKDIFGNSVPLAGMYTHGEAWPLQSIDGQSYVRLQNQSIILMALC